MSLWRELLEGAGDRTLHATLLDPASTAPGEGGKLAEALATAGSDLFLVGGSTDVTSGKVQATVDVIHEHTEVPVLLFPSSHRQIASGLDGVLFTLPFNSTHQGLLIEEPAMGAEPVVQAGLEAVTTAYVIVEPGMTVGRVAAADLVPRGPEGLDRVRRYAYLARVLGLDALYLEAGSGAPEPVPPSHIEAVAETGVPIIVGGGIREPGQAVAAADAGARLVVTGTVAEQGNLEAVRSIIRALNGL